MQKNQSSLALFIRTRPQNDLFRRKQPADAVVGVAAEIINSRRKCHLFGYVFRLTNECFVFTDRKSAISAVQPGVEARDLSPNGGE